MEILYKLEKPAKIIEPCGLTIGSFDGVHIGHQYLLSRLREKIGPKATLAVLSFINHPSHLVKERKPVKNLVSPEEKIKLLEKFGVDVLYLLEFTPKVMETSYDQFFKTIKEVFPFSYLILGKGASVGKNRDGTEARVKDLGKTLHFEAEYLEKLKHKGRPVSSGAIRECLEKGEIDLATEMLGN